MYRDRVRNKLRRKREKEGVEDIRCIEVIYFPI